jgi:hypothetical protein
MTHFMEVSGNASERQQLMLQSYSGINLTFHSLKCRLNYGSHNQSCDTTRKSKRRICLPDLKMYRGGMSSFSLGEYGEAETFTGSLRSLGSRESSFSRKPLQRESIEYDRRQIRRIMADKLVARGLIPDVEMVNIEEDWEDDESIYDDTEFYPWKQREAAVAAASVGGKTEGRMEGYDSLERALNAHQHQIHYGRGSNFGWSAQQKTMSSTLRNTQELVRSLNNNYKQSTWTSFRDLGQVQMEDDIGDGSDVLTQSPNQHGRTNSRESKMFAGIIVLVAIVATVGFAFYIELLKIQHYEFKMPSTATGEIFVVTDNPPSETN